MTKYHLTGHVSGSKHLGVYEANSPEEALQKALDDERVDCSVCHQCSSEVEDPGICKVSVWNTDTDEETVLEV